MPIIQSGGAQSILQSSSTGSGSWYRVHHEIAKLSFQVIHTATSVGASVSSTVVIEASNDGINPLGTVLGTVALAGDTLQSDGFVMDAHWEYVRAKINSVAAATAGSTGPTFGINVMVSPHAPG